MVDINNICKADKGIVILNTVTGEYYCGLNKFDKQLRKAKIYHSKKWAEEAIDTYIKNHKQYNKQDYTMLNVVINIELRR